MSASSGAQIQVSLRGAQDILLMSPKEDTLFRVDYRRNTNYAAAEAEQSTDTTALLGRRNIQTKISRAGDLLSQVYLHAHFDALLPVTTASAGSDVGGTHQGWVNGLGYAMIEDITMLIGNKQFDNMDGQFMYMREQVAEKPECTLGQAVGYYESEGDRWYASMQPQDLYVPLQFWFNNYIEQSLPVIGLYWHEMQINLTLRAQADLIYSIGTPVAHATDGMTEMNFICNFQYLDRPERALFANQKLEQIFIQHQDLGTESWTTATNASLTVNIRMNHPITDLMWAPVLDPSLRSSNADSIWNPYFNFDGAFYIPPATIDLGNPDAGLIQTPYKSAQIFFNNQQRTVVLTSDYLNQIPQHRSQTRIGKASSAARVAGYSFAAKANDILHTGSANFSRFDQATVKFNLWTAADETGYTDGATFWRNNASVKVHARNCKLMPPPLPFFLPYRYSQNRPQGNSTRRLCENPFNPPPFLPPSNGLSPPFPLLYSGGFFYSGMMVRPLSTLFITITNSTHYTGHQYAIYFIDIEPFYLANQSPTEFAA